MILSRIADRETAQQASEFMEHGAKLIHELISTMPESSVQSINRLLAGDYLLAIECSCDQHGRVGLCLTAVAPPSEGVSSRRVVLSSLQVPTCGLAPPPQQ